MRYAPGSHFSAHGHPGGEEFLVLDGVFSDERGDHPEGTYLLNPEGYAHAPFSREGCELFVKLRQYPGRGRTQVRIDTHTAAWEPVDLGQGPLRGVTRLRLYAEPEHPEVMHLLRIEALAEIPGVEMPRGEEVIALLVRLFSGTTSEEIASANLSIIEKLGFAKHLSMSRANGFASMVQMIKRLASQS